MRVSCTKQEAAIRQLDEAVVMLLTDRDPLAVRTLAAAAHSLLADLADKRGPSNSFRSSLIKGLELPPKDAFALLHRVQNFLKHADRDPDESLSFEVEENDHLILMAILEFKNLELPLTENLNAFLVWYLACYIEEMADANDAHDENALKAFFRNEFPGINSMSRKQKLLIGVKLITEPEERLEVNLSSHSPI
jgi:hypothetical protein